MNTYKKIALPVPMGVADASDVAYDNTGSGLVATNMQAAVDELAMAVGAAYVKVFIVGDWVLNVDLYELEILESIHNKGTAPTLQVYEDNLGTFEEVGVGIEVSNLGDIKLTITSTPDARFAGRVIIR